MAKLFASLARMIKNYKWMWLVIGVLCIMFGVLFIWYPEVYVKVVDFINEFTGYFSSEEVVTAIENVN